MTDILTEPHSHIPRKVLTIAGSDSGGGAGIQADLKTFTSLESFGTSVITSLTSQNTLKVDAIHPVPAEFVSKQLEAVLSDIGTDAIKIGMLCNAGIIRATSQTLRKHYPNADFVETRPKLVLDPVMIASSGAALLDSAAVSVLIEQLLPLCLVLTPNVPEAEWILQNAKKPLTTNVENPESLKIKSLDEMKAAAKDLAKLGPAIVLLKGGHLPFFKNSGLALTPEEFANLDQPTTTTGSSSDPSSSSLSEPVLELVDLVYDSRSDTFIEHRKDFLRTSSTHGTGCTLSAAIASYLAHGIEVHQAIEQGTQYVQSALRDGLTVGHGKGCLNHFHHVIHRSIEKPTRFNPHPLTTHLLKTCEEDWYKYTHHEFVQRIGDGTLPKESFIHYLKQDYLYLQTYARAHGLGSFKARTMEEIKGFADIVVHIAKESQLHVEFCAQWGISYKDILATPESMANVAYTRYVLDIGMTGDLLELGLAIAPCLLGYGDIGKRLYNDPKTLKGDQNPYWKWIEAYNAADYRAAVITGIANLERQGAIQAPSASRMKRLEEIFGTATRLEISFWDMSMHRL